MNWIKLSRHDKLQHHALICSLWSLAVILGAIDAWYYRHNMSPDGISYLDVADAYLRGDWEMAINGYWSPLYSWLLGVAMMLLSPTPYWEASVVHLVNLVIFLGTLASAHFFLREFLSCHAERVVRHSEEQNLISLPGWAFWVLGYVLVIWSSLNLISIREESPDMCVAAFVYLAAGVLLRIRRGLASALTFALLGVILGFGYLSKAAMFPLSFIFLGVSLFSVGNLRQALPRVLSALVIFLLVGGPFLFALSKAKGRLTFGDVGKLAYVWFVHDVTPFIHWQGEGNVGVPKHATRRIFSAPIIYEFASPNMGTYPPWYDPSYWYEGVRVGFDWKAQLAVLVENIRGYFRTFFESVQSGLIVGFLILYTMGRRGWFCVRDLLGQWNLLIPAMTAFGMYSLVYIETRYIGAYVVLLWLGIAAGVQLPESQQSRRLATTVSMAMILLVTSTVMGLNLDRAYTVGRYLLKWRDPRPHFQWHVANSLQSLGVEKGDRVASIGRSFDAYWARLARVQIVAEIPKKQAFDFWAADPVIKSQVIKAFASTGAKIIVADVGSLITGEDWKRIANTRYYVYLLK